MAPVPRALAAVALNESVSRPEEVVRSSESSVPSAQPVEAVHEDSNSFQMDSCKVYRTLVVVFVGIGALVSAVKWRARFAGPRVPQQTTTEAVRRAAIEALLSKQKMK
jgi:hypothetical protein